MQKIKTLFLRDPEDRRFVTPNVTPETEWVIAGEGVATRKYDGTCVAFYPHMSPERIADVPELQGWWARREVKPDGIEPPGWVLAEVDEITGKSVGWEPADRSAFAKYLVEAVRNLTDGPNEGTHELLGPKINRDPERIGKHVVIAHQDADRVAAPRNFEGLTRWLLAQPYEGVVWHHPDGRMVKLKRRDMRR